MSTEKKLVKAYLDEGQWKWAKLQADETGQSVSEWIGSLIEKDRGGIEVMAPHPPKVRVDPSAEMPTAPAATEEAKPLRPANHKRCSSGTCPWCN